MFERVCQGVYLVAGPNISDSSDCMCYALNLGKTVLIDCGCGPGYDAMINNISQTGMDPSHIHTLIITHAHVDHMGAAARLKNNTHCKIIAHDLDSKPIENADEKRTAADWYHISLQPTKIDKKITTNTHTLKFPKADLHLLHTPGHTPGSMVAWMDTPQGRVLFGQDIHGPFSPAFGSHIPDWRKSMQKLKDLEPDILCEGHLGIIQGKNEIIDFIDSHLRRH